MNAIIQEWIVDNDAWAAAKAKKRPRLSVLIPFLHDDPHRLMDALDREAPRLKTAVEIVLLDDGTGDDDLAHAVIEAVKAMRLPTRLIQLFVNEGRSRGRNRLARHSRAEHLLFLDSDMLPDSEDFLGRYLQLLEAEAPAIVFGGFSLDQTDPWPEHRLHGRLAARSDCAPASVRRRNPAKFVFTSNLMVRRDLFQAEPFNEDFVGWGWEDVEWGVRLSRSHAIVHIDNPATHLGLDSPHVIAQKYEQSAENFGRILEAHPDVVSRYPTYRLGRMLKIMPLLRYWRGVFKAVALTERAPLSLRAFCMRFYRCAVTADAI